MRDTCLLCLRPRSACFCAELPPLRTRTRVVFLQHPRERRVAINTVRLLHRGLAESERRVAVHFDDDRAVQSLCRQDGVALLFPGASSRPARSFSAPPATLVVIDGTWPQARKILRLNAGLAALPRIGFIPRSPSGYRIRRELAPHCLSTLEAVIEVLSDLEGDPARFLPLRAAFDRMVDLQIASAAHRTLPRRRRLRSAHPRPRRVPLGLGDSRIVLVQAEANAEPLWNRARLPPELIHWCAVRPSSGERFEAVVRPRRSLAEGTPRHLGLQRSAILEGEPLAEALRRFAAFLGPEGPWGVWGGFTLRLFADGGVRPPDPLDIRHLVANLRQCAPGPLEQVPEALPVESPPGTFGLGRAGRRLSALTRVWSALQRPSQVGEWLAATG